MYERRILKSSEQRTSEHLRCLVDAEIAFSRIYAFCDVTRSMFTIPSDKLNDRANSTAGENVAILQEIENDLFELYQKLVHKSHKSHRGEPEHLILNI